MYVDVHTHLTHRQFDRDLEQVVARAAAAGLGAIVVNGLEPVSNRRVLELTERYPPVRAALGIYPVNAVCDLLPDDFVLDVETFDVEAELQFIDEAAAAGRLSAIGECGLDGHWVGPETHARQEEVFERLIEIAVRHDLPVLVHSRKLEQRAAEILRHMRIRRVDMHCYGGNVKQGLTWAREDGWWFSIPANARRIPAFTSLLRELPEERILTETDAPYLAPERGRRSEPADVVETVTLLAEIKGWDVERARDLVWRNYRALFTDGRREPHRQSAADDDSVRRED